jgi:hypothetical protein
MRRLAVLIGLGLALAIFSLAPSVASAALTQCPPVDKDTGCQFLIVVSNSGVTVPNDPSQGPYDGEDDTLVGIENTSSSAISSFPLSSSKNIYGFDGDGLCDPPAPPRAPGCIVLAKNKEGVVPTKIKPGQPCEHEPADPEGQEEEEPCGFEPAGEPSGLTSFGDGGELVGFTASGDAVAGYEGPRVWFTNINSEGTSGTINFSPALASGEHTYFALEEALFESSLTLGNPTTIATTLAGGGQSGSSITVLQGTPVTDSSTLGGTGVAAASGTVSYTVYSNPECTTVAAAAGSSTVAGTAGGVSTAVSSLAPGTYYWRASYSGNVINNQAVSSTCGTTGEVLTVQAPTTTTTIQTGGGVIGASIPVLKGSPVTDQATIAGAEAGSATGTVTYTLYKEATCKTVLATSVASVTAGVAGASVAVSPSVGTYYWVASYSGGGLNAPSASACGSEKLIVSTKANLGLPNGKKCFSKRAFAIHPRFPKGAKIISYQEFINGNLVKQGKLSKHATTVDLIGLPKGAYKVELLTFAANGASYEDTRTFHTCVAKKHHKKH